MSDSIQLVQEFFEKLRFAKRSEETIKQYAPKLEAFSTFIRDTHGLSIDDLTDIKQVKGFMLHEYQKRLREEGASETLEMAHISAIKSFFSWLSRFGYIDANPSGAFLAIRVPKKDQPHFSWSEAEEIFAKYESWNTERDIAILGIGFTMGLRASSIALLNIGDIGKGEDNQITYRNKGGDSKTVFAPAEVMRAIRMYMQRDRYGAAENQPLFVSRSGNRIDRKTVLAVCKRAGSIIGRDDGTAHAMRRTNLSKVNELAGIEMAQAVGQHASQQMTERYIYDSAERMDQLYKGMSLMSFTKDI